MKEFYLSFSFAIISLLACSPADNDVLKIERELAIAAIGSSPLDTEQSERKYSLMEREMEYLMVIWPGEYDNVEQLSFEKDAGRKNLEQGQHKRIHSKVMRVYNDQLSEYLLYIEEYQDNDTNNVYRQQIFQLISEDANSSIRLKMYNIKNGQNIWRSANTMNQIQKLEKSDFIVNADCDMLIQREGKEFVGKTIIPSCQTKEDNTFLNYQIEISRNIYSFRYLRMNASTGAIVADHQREDWYILDKARCFVCMIDFPRKPGGRPVDTRYYIDIHDQGGQFDFDYGDGRHMVLTMRNTWSYGMQRNTFVIVLQENNLEGPTLIYSWGSDGADRIGMNPGWIRVQCDLKNDKNIRLQHGLRPDS